MKIKLNPIITEAHGPYLAGQGRFRLATLRNRDIVLQTRKSKLSEPHTVTAHTYSKLLWHYLDGCWKCIGRDNQILWGKCVRRTARKARSGLDEFRAVNLPRLMYGMPGLLAPPDRFSSQLVYMDRHGSSAFTCRSPRTQVFIEGDDKAGHHFNAATGAIQPIMEPPNLFIPDECPTDCARWQTGLRGVNVITYPNCTEPGYVDWLGHMDRYPIVFPPDPDNPAHWHCDMPCMWSTTAHYELEHECEDYESWIVRLGPIVCRVGYYDLGTHRPPDCPRYVKFGQPYQWCIKANWGQPYPAMDGIALFTRSMALGTPEGIWKCRFHFGDLKGCPNIDILNFFGPSCGETAWCARAGTWVPQNPWIHHVHGWNWMTWSLHTTNHWETTDSGSYAWYSDVICHSSGEHKDYWTFSFKPWQWETGTVTYRKHASQGFPSPTGTYTLYPKYPTYENAPLTMKIMPGPYETWWNDYDAAIVELNEAAGPLLIAFAVIYGGYAGWRAAAHYHYTHAEKSGMWIADPEQFTRYAGFNPYGAAPCFGRTVQGPTIERGVLRAYMRMCQYSLTGDDRLLYATSEYFAKTPP